MGPDRLDQQVTSLGDTTADHDDSGVEHGCESGDALPQPSTEGLQLLDGELVAVLRRLGDQRAGDGIDVSTCEVKQPPRHERTLTGQLAGLANECRAAGVLLPAPAVATTADQPVRHHPDVADLGRHAEGSSVQLAVQDDAAADTGPDRHQHEVVDVGAGTEGELPPGGGVGVVLDDHGQTEPRLQVVLEVLVTPGEVRREQHGRPLDVDEPCRADADSLDVVGSPQFGDEVVNRALDVVRVGRR